MDEIIRTEKIVKHFGRVKAVEGISLSVKKGEIYGFLGLNGAGKTTTIRMLLGMVRPTSGEAYLFGRRVYADRLDLWKRVGYLVETPYSYPELTVEENLEIIRRLRFLADPETVPAVIEALGLGPYRDRRARHLSLGNAQRLGLAKALIHRPDILILDEPANGLDPAGIVEIRELILDLARNSGVTVFISSHILGEISRFATRIGIIHEGRLIKEADMGQFDRERYRRLCLTTRDLKGTALVLEKEGYNVKNGNRQVLEVTGKESLQRPESVASLLVQSGHPPVMLKVEEENLESYFFRVIGKNGERP